MPFDIETIIPYAQKIVKTNSADFYVEILSRPRWKPGAAPINIAEFFHRLAPAERFEIFDAQNHLADQLFAATRITSSINLDNELVESEDFRTQVLQSIEGANAPTIYEFTEVHPMPPSELMNPIFKVLRDAGKRSALDDFGTGFNGMSLFVDFDFDIVKIDRSLIVDIDVRPVKLKVLRLICEMIETLGKEHVVEGVETPSQLNKLRECGFHTFQGFALHRPDPVERFFEVANHSQQVSV